MASAPIGVWGIDLGQCGLKALRLTLADGEVVATAFDYIEHPKILSQPDADPDQLTRAALEQFLSRNQTRGDTIAISVPGQTGLARFVKLPPVESKKIPDIVRFEAKQQIPFPLDEVVWDWQTIGSGGVTEDFVENEIGLFAMKRDMVNRYLQAFKDVNVEVHYVQMAPLALCNYITFDVLGKGGAKSEASEEKGQCVVALDIGADNTNLIVTDGERIIWQRPIPIGGNHFTRALTKDMKLTFAKAEHLKRNATKAEDPKKIFQSMKPVFSDFAGELQRSLGFFSNTHRQAQIKKMVGLGNAFRLPGLQKFLSQTLGVEMHKVDSFARLKGDEVTQSPVYSENILSFPVAYGLALQGIGVTRLKTNLLPQEIQFERLVRSKKPWVAVAAASLLVGTGVFGIFSGFNFSVAFGASKAAEDAQAVMAREKRLKNQFDEQQKKMVEAREQAAAILRGAEERTNWAIIHRYINECLPQPDGWHVPRGVYARYWTDAARSAYLDKKGRDEEGRKEETNLSELIQINLQSVYGRYCGTAELANVYNFVKAKALDLEPLNHQDWKVGPPKDLGWFLEVRGYTYHKDGINFVRSTFLDNLRSRKLVMSPLNDPSAHPLKLDVSHVAILAHDAQVLSPTHHPPFIYINSGLHLNDGVKGSGRVSGAAPPPASSSGGGSSGQMSVGDGTGGAGGGGGSSKRQDPWTGMGGALGAAGSLGGSAPTDRGAGGYPGAPAGIGGGGGNVQLPGGPAGGGFGGSPAGGSSVPEPKLKAGERKRTEFVIVFYWKEPLPSEPKDQGGDQSASLEGGGDVSGSDRGSGGYPGYGGGGYPGPGGPGGGYPGRPD
jgi:type IV pilus assembly protein PilM